MTETAAPSSRGSMPRGTRNLVRVLLEFHCFKLLFWSGQNLNPSFGKRAAQPSHVFAIGRLDGAQHVGGRDVRAGERPVVRNFLNARARVRDQPRQSREPSGPVTDDGREAE